MQILFFCLSVFCSAKWFVHQPISIHLCFFRTGSHYSFVNMLIWQMFATRQVLKHDNKGLWFAVFLGCFIQSELLYKYLQAALQCCNISMYFPGLAKSQWLMLSVKKRRCETFQTCLWWCFIYGWRNLICTCTGEASGTMFSVCWCGCTLKKGKTSPEHF